MRNTHYKLILGTAVFAFSFGSSLAPLAAEPHAFIPSYETAPAPIIAHDATDIDTSWLNDDGVNETARKYLNKALNADGMQVEALLLTGTHAELRFRNNRYNVTPQAFGRAARAMANVLPSSVQTFTLTPVVNGLPVSSVSFNRTDLETFEHHPNGTKLSFQAAQVSDAPSSIAGLQYDPSLYPRFTWAFGPNIELNYDDATSDSQYSVRARIEAKYIISPGLSFSGAISKELFGNVSTNTPSTSTLQHVRSDNGLYIANGDPAVETLKVDYLFKPAPALYARISAGYLERNFGGVSAELLWKPADRNWGLGVEVNHVKQRDFSKAFGFQNYSVTSGHVSAYYEFNHGISTRLDVGRYLAGDKGATLSIDKRFANGWSAGVFATKSNANVADDLKTGFRVSIPLNWIMKTPTRATYDIAVGSTGGDAGSRLRVDNRLYDMLREYHRPELQDSWGRFWR